MLFNSYEFLFAFLPIALGGFFWLNRARTGQSAVTFLAVASVVFYAWTDYRYVLLLGASIVWNWMIGRRLSTEPSKGLLVVGIAGNVLALAYYKYGAFFANAVASGLGWGTDFRAVALPLGISFFSFTQIAFLVDAYRGAARERGIANYVLFVTFFPHLVAGPVLHHKEMMPQFAAIQGNRPDARTVANGLFLLAVGLFKKLIVADYIARLVDPAFANVGALQIMDAWTATLGYTLQLYFDFSAYSEMAMGIALLFGISLPKNFNSPYKAADIADFWKRWHMTLSRFLRDYLYIPLGGNRRGYARMLAALLITMVLGGLWHGAGWQFIAWGGIHGFLLVGHRLWRDSGASLPDWLGRTITFVAVMLAWVMFRAASVQDGLLIWRKMFGLDGVVLPVVYRSVENLGVRTEVSPFINGIEIYCLIVLAAFCMSSRNVHEVWESWAAPRRRHIVGLTAMTLASLFVVNRASSFLYWSF